jgi:hypothetical protein
LYLFLWLFSKFQMVDDTTLIWQAQGSFYSAVGETVMVMAWGKDSVRVLASPFAVSPADLAALLPLSHDQGNLMLLLVFALPRFLV